MDRGTKLKCFSFLFQMYVHHGIHDLIFNFVGTLEASQVGVNSHCSATFNNTDETHCLTSCGFFIEISVFLPLHHIVTKWITICFWQLLLLWMFFSVIVQYIETDGRFLSMFHFPVMKTAMNMDVYGHVSDVFSLLVMISCLFCCSSTGCRLQQNQQESAGAAAERPGSQTWVQVSSTCCSSSLCVFSTYWTTMIKVKGRG